mgnify:CR=1 FL=1
MLPVCLGKATKVCDLLTDKSKEYEAVLLLGKVTDTQDITGTVLEEKDVKVTEEAVRETVLSFVGDYMQIPPMYSALKSMEKNSVISQGGQNRRASGKTCEDFND